MGAADRARILAALAECESELDRRNALPAGALAQRIGRLRGILAGPRLPRVAAIGRRGAGKSSLLNALAAQELARVGDVRDETRLGRWHQIAWSDRAIEWLDTPGLRAAGRAGRREQVIAEVNAAPPDVLLVLCQAAEVDAGIAEDLADAQSLLLALATPRDGRPAVVGVVTKVDELAPPDVASPPFDDPEKRANIQSAVRVFGRHLRRAGLAPASVLPVATYARFGPNGVDDDLRWNLGTLRARVAALLPDDAALSGRLRSRDTRALLRGAFHDVTESFSALISPDSGPTHRDAVVTSLARVLRGMGPDADRLVRSRDVVARERGPLGSLRSALDRLDPEPHRAPVRRLGRTLARVLLDDLDDEAYRALFDSTG